MVKIFYKIKQILLNIISKNRVKKLEAPKEIELTEDSKYRLNSLDSLNVENKVSEKDRIFKLYNKVKNKDINLNDIARKDLLKIRRLLLEEAKMQDKMLEDGIKTLETIKENS